MSNFFISLGIWWYRICINNLVVFSFHIFRADWWILRLFLRLVMHLVMLFLTKICGILEFFLLCLAVKVYNLKVLWFAWFWMVLISCGLICCLVFACWYFFVKGKFYFPLIALAPGYAFCCNSVRFFLLWIKVFGIISYVSLESFGSRCKLYHYS